MKQIKPIIIFSSFLIILSFIIPSLLVMPFSKNEPSAGLNEKMESPPKEKVNIEDEKVAEVAVLRNKTKTIEKLPLEEYVVGVVASEMPAEFEKEALKAQALAARTYIVSRLLQSNRDELPEGADVTDTVNHQVYKSTNELKKEWGADYETKIAKVAEAVEDTKGEILTYDNKPITAQFFSMSNGYTENAEDYWEATVPYLKSVESPWDSKFPKFTVQKVVSLDEFEQRLNVNIKQTNDLGTITARTTGNKVAKVKIGGKEYTGREIREKLNLRSTDFSWEKKGNSIVITTRGYGHGVGMSQYGANGMAKEGKTYSEIVHHYYQGIDITTANQYFDQKFVLK